MVSEDSREGALEGDPGQAGGRYPCGGGGRFVLTVGYTFLPCLLPHLKPLPEAALPPWSTVGSEPFSVKSHKEVY